MARSRLAPAALCLMIASCANSTSSARNSSAASQYPYGISIPGKKGYVLSPYNNQVVDVAGLPAGSLCADPRYPASAKKHFRVPGESATRSRPQETPQLADNTPKKSGLGAFGKAVFGTLLDTTVAAAGVIAENPQLLSNSGAGSTYSPPSSPASTGSGYSSSSGNSTSYSPSNPSPVTTQTQIASTSGSQAAAPPSRPKTLGMVTPIVGDRGQLGMQSSATETVRVEYRLVYKESVAKNLGKSFSDLTCSIGPKSKFLTMYSSREATLIVLRVY